MKKIYFLLGTVLLLCCFLNFAQAQTNNYADNGGFEDGYLNWNTWAFEGAQAKFEIESEAPLSGSRSAKYTLLSQGTNIWSSMFEHYFTLHGDEEIMVSITMKANNDNTPVNVEMAFGYGPYTNIVLEDVMVGTTAETFTWTLPTEATNSGFVYRSNPNFKFGLRLAKMPVGTVLWIDDLIIAETDGEWDGNILAHGEFNGFGDNGALATTANPKANGGWYFTSNVTRDASSKLSGVNSMKIASGVNDTLAHYFQAKAGNLYNLSFDVVASAAGSFTASMGTNGALLNETVNATTTTQRVTIPTTSPTLVRGLQSLIFKGFPAGTDVWIDNVMLAERAECEMAGTASGNTEAFNYRINATGDWLSGANIKVEEGQTVEFGPWPTGNAYTWTWRGPNGWTAEARGTTTPAITAATAGDYTAFYTATDGSCSGVMTFRIELSEPEVPASDVTLSNLQVGGATVAGFDPMATDYHVILPTGTTSAELAATATDANATVVAPATVDVTSGTATADVVVTGADGTTVATYQVHFTVVPETNPGAKTIVLITPTDPAESYKDSEQRAWLIRKGFNVPVYYNTNLSTAPQADIDMLNAADLVIIGRGPASSAFQSAENKTAWNNLTVPVIMNSMYIARSSRLNWFKSTTISKTDPSAEEFIIAEVTDPSLPVFSGVEIGENNRMPWSATPDETLIVTEATNGTVLAKSVVPANGMLFVRFAAGTPFYTDAVDAPAGERTYFGFGNDNNAAYPDNYFPLTDEGRKVYLAEINRLTGVDLTDASLSAINLSAGDITFDPATFTYDVTLPAGTETVNVDAIASNSQASVSGEGDVDVSSGSGVATIEVTSADGSASQTYTINFTVEEEQPSDVATLSGITLSAGTINFDPATESYNVVLPAGTSSVTVGATPTDENAEATGTGSVDVSSGTGTATIVVTAEDGTSKKTYTINFTVEPSSVAGLVAQGVNVYPNPVNGYGVLHLDRAADIVSVKVYTAQGVLVKTISAENVDTISINVADLADGLYLLKAVKNDRSVLSGKFVK